MIYTVKDELTLSQVSARVYGDPSLWPTIRKANLSQFREKSEDHNITFPGEKLVVPDLPGRTITPKRRKIDKDEMAVFINGVRVYPMAIRINKAFNILADEVMLVIPWSYGENQKIDEAIKPYSYSEIIVDIGSTRVFTGVIYRATTRNEVRGITAELTCATRTADLIDSNVSPPFQKDKTTFGDLVNEVVEPLGFMVVKNVDSGGEISRATANEKDTIATYILRLAKQLGLIVTCNEYGGIEIIRSNQTGTPLATIIEGDTPGASFFGVRWDGRTAFNTYRVVGNTPFGASEEIIKDDSVPSTRIKTVRADETFSGDLGKAGLFEKNKALAGKAGDIHLAGWYNGDNLWEYNKIVTVKSPTMFIPDGFNYLINGVEFMQNSEGKKTTLRLVDPKTYTVAQ